MKEFIISDISNEILNILESDLTPLAKTLCGESDKYSNQNRYYLYYKIPAKFAKYFQKDLIEDLVNNLLYLTKSSFYSSKLMLKDTDIYSFIMKRALVFADFIDCGNKIRKAICNNNMFYIDGIKNFLLSSDIDLWQNIVDVTNNGFFSINKQSMLKEYLRCVTENIDSKFDTLYLMGDKEVYLMTSNLKRLEFSFDYGNRLSNEQLLLSTLLEYFPEKLVIYSKNLPDDLQLALNILYDDVKNKQDI